MSTGKQAKTAAAAAAATPAAAEAKSSSLLDQILDKMPRAVEPERGLDLIKALVEESLTGGTVIWDRSVIKTIDKAIEQLDAALSKQLAAIMHRPEFQKLEGTWRGLNYLVMNSETSKDLQVRVLNVSKRDLFKDLDRAVEFDQSQMFKKIYETEFGMPGGTPYGALIGDYEFTNHPEDLDILQKMSQVGAAAFCPFISAAAPALFSLDSFTQLSKPRDLEKTFLDIKYTKWNSFRDSEDSRFVVLTMPRVLSRLPYGSQTKVIDEFNYEEVELDSKGNAKPVPNEHYAWMNASYVLGTKLTDAFAKTGWCTAIRGAENGGKVEGLPAHIFTSDDGDADLKCPTEIGITDRREAELSKLGFLALNHYKEQDYAVFFGAQSVQRPKKYDRHQATENAAISARLPYLMATSRISHYLKAIARDKIGSFMERQDMEDFLKRWIARYICADERPSPEMKAQYPLAAAEIEVQSVPGKPGAYNAICWLRPWLQLEELNASMRLVTALPKKAT